MSSGNISGIGKNTGLYVHSLKTYNNTSNEPFDLVRCDFVLSERCENIQQLLTYMNKVNIEIIPCVGYVYNCRREYDEVEDSYTLIVNDVNYIDVIYVDEYNNELNICCCQTMPYISEGSHLETSFVLNELTSFNDKYTILTYNV